MSDTFDIGASVKSADGFSGIVTDVAPGGLLVVQKPGQPAEQRTFTAPELRRGPPLPTYHVGQHVRLNGGVGEVVSRDADGLFTVAVRRKRRGFEYLHRYHVPAWRIAVGP